MYTLILILSLRSIYHHEIDIKNIPHLTKQNCESLSNKLKSQLHTLNKELQVESFCEPQG